MPYPGGKNGAGVYQTIINRMPPHDIYVEPFLGGGAIMRLKRPARLSIGVDLDRDPLVSFAGDAGGIMEIAPSGLARGAGAAVTGTGIVNPNDSGRLLFHGDALDFLSSFPFAGSELVYCDPPYMLEARTSGPLYRCEMDVPQHERLLALLRTLPCMVMISGYHTNLYAKELADWHECRYQAMTRAGKPRTEYLWSNFKPDAELHDYTFAGKNFREREALKRKTKRLTVKFDGLPETERLALLHAIGGSTSSADARSTSPASQVPAVTELGSFALDESHVTLRSAAAAGGSQLLLSLFPGIDLLGRGFEAEGFAVVRGPDLIFGGDIRRFHAPAGRFAGVIAGSPCPDFSHARRTAPTGEGMAMLQEFRRIVEETRPDWWLLENVPTVPDLQISGYSHQRLDIDPRDLGLEQRRLRHFQFGHRNGFLLALPRPTARRGGEATLLASTSGQRSFSEFCRLQGLPEDYDLPGFTVGAKFRAVGNGVHVDVARLVAAAIRRPVSALTRLCGCGCARPVKGKAQTAGVACRKRLQRKRDSAPGIGDRGVTEPSVTHQGSGNPGESHLDIRFERWWIRRGRDARSNQPIG